MCIPSPSATFSRWNKRFVCIVRFVSLALVGLLCFSAAKASTDSLVLDFPLAAQPKNVPWLSDAPMEWEMYAGRRIELPVARLNNASRLAVTVLFEDAPGLSLRATWEPDSPAPPTQIGINLSDGISGWNSKTFIVPPSLTAAGGMLVLETTGTSRIVHRLAAEILQSAPLFALPKRKNDPVFSIGKRFFSEEELRPDPRPAPPDAWSENLIEAYLQDQPESIREGLEFRLEIRPSATRAVLRFEINGTSETPEIWVNGYRVPNVSVEVPELRSPCYLQPVPGADIVYAGWRKGWAYLPPSYLRLGENVFFFSSGNSEDFVRETRLEMWFNEPLLPPASPSAAEVLQDLEKPLSPPPDPSPTPLPPSPAASPTPSTVNLSEIFRTSLL